MVYLFSFDKYWCQGGGGERGVTLVNFLTAGLEASPAVDRKYLLFESFWDYFSSRSLVSWGVHFTWACSAGPSHQETFCPPILSSSLLFSSLLFSSLLLSSPLLSSPLLFSLPLTPSLPLSLFSFSWSLPQTPSPVTPSLSILPSN